MGVQQSLHCCEVDRQDGSTPGFPLDIPLSSLGHSCRRSRRTSYRSYLSHEDLNPDHSACSGIMAHILNSNKKRGKKKKGLSNLTIRDIPGIKIISPGGSSKEAEVDVNSNIKTDESSSSSGHRQKKHEKNNKSDTPDSLRVNNASSSSDTTLEKENSSSTLLSQTTKTTDLSSDGSRVGEHLLEWASQEESLVGYDTSCKCSGSVTTPEDLPGDGTDIKLHVDRHNRSLCSPCGYLSPSVSSSAYDVFEDGEDEDGQDGVKDGVIEELRKNFQKCIIKFAELNAMVDGMSSQSWSYAELGLDVERVTIGLRKAGLGPGHRLVLIGPNSPQAVLTILATLALGATLVLVSHNDQPERLLSKMRKVKPTIVVTSTCCHSAALWAAGCCASVKKAYEIGGLSGKCYPFSRLLDEEESPDTKALQTRHDGIALIVFSHDLNDRGYLRKFTYGSVLKRLQSSLDCSDLRYRAGHHVVLLALPLIEPFTLMNLLFTGFIQGYRFITLPHWESRRALKVCQQYKVTYLAVSSLWYTYLTKLSNMRKMISLPEVVVVYGSVSCVDPTQFRSLQRLGAEHILVVYGMAETLGAVAVAHMTTSSSLALKKLDNVQIKIVSPQSDVEQVKALTEGQVYVLCKDMTSQTSPTRQLKYTQPEGGNEWLATGDTGFLDAAGKLHIIGHESEKLIEGENELWLCDVEQVLRRSPAIADVAIVDLKKVTAVVVLRPGFKDITAPDVIKIANAAQAPSDEGASPVKVQQVEFTSSIPRSGNGRVMRRTLAHDVTQMLTCNVPWTTL